MESNIFRFKRNDYYIRFDWFKIYL